VDLVASEMIAVHNCLLRAINAVYLQAANVEATGDEAVIAAFVNFATLWSDIVHEHHHNEETKLFPDIEALVGAPGCLQANVEQHHQFEPGLHAYQAFVADVSAGKEKFSAAKLKGIIDGFMPVLTQHLHDEIETLKGLKKYGEDVDWETYMQELNKRLRAKSPPNAMVSNILPPLSTLLIPDFSSTVSFQPRPGAVGGKGPAR
jgi:hypothetical protein